MLHSPALRLYRDKSVEIRFRFEKLIDLRRRDGLQKIHTVFLLDIEQCFFQCYLTAVGLMTEVEIGPPDLYRITVIDRPEFLRFFIRQLQPVGDEPGFIGLQLTGERSLSAL